MGKKKKVESSQANGGESAVSHPAAAMGDAPSSPLSPSTAAPAGSQGPPPARGPAPVPAPPTPLAPPVAPAQAQAPAPVPVPAPTSAPAPAPALPSNVPGQPPSPSAPAAKAPAAKAPAAPLVTATVPVAPLKAQAAPSPAPAKSVPLVPPPVPAAPPAPAPGSVGAPPGLSGGPKAVGAPTAIPAPPVGQTSAQPAATSPLKSGPISPPQSPSAQQAKGQAGGVPSTAAPLPPPPGIPLPQEPAPTVPQAAKPQQAPKSPPVKAADKPDTKALGKPEHKPTAAKADKPEEKQQAPKNDKVAVTKTEKNAEEKTPAPKVDIKQTEKPAEPSSPKQEKPDAKIPVGKPATDKVPAKSSDKVAPNKADKASEKAPAGKQEKPSEKPVVKNEKTGEKSPSNKSEKTVAAKQEKTDEKAAPNKLDKSPEKSANKGDKPGAVKNQKAEEKPPTPKTEKSQAGKSEDKQVSDTSAKAEKTNEKANKPENKQPEKAVTNKSEEAAKTEKIPTGKPDNKATTVKAGKVAPAKVDEKADANKQQKTPTNQADKIAAENKSAKTPEKKGDKATGKTEKPGDKQEKAADKKAEKGVSKPETKAIKKPEPKPEVKTSKAGENKENKPDNKVAGKGDTKAVLKEAENKADSQAKEEAGKTGGAEKSTTSESVSAAAKSETIAVEGEVTKKKKRGRRGGKGKKTGENAGQGDSTKPQLTAGGSDQQKAGQSASAKKRNRRKKKAATTGAADNAPDAVKDEAPKTASAPGGKAGDEGPQSQEKKKLQPPSMSNNFHFGGHSSEKNPHSSQNKILQPDGKTMFQQCIFPEVPPTKPSDAYVNQFTKCLQLLAKAKEGPRPDTDPHHMTDSDDELEYDIVQRTVFLPHACHICKALVSKDNRPLQTCDQCQMISYCSEEHRKEHWPIHRDLCQVISKICQLEGLSHILEKAKGLSAETFRNIRVYYMVQAIGELGHDLELWEKEMFYFCKVCHTCYESDPKKLVACSKCLYINFCQPEHLKSDHNEWCKDFKLYTDLVRYQSHNGMIQPTLPSSISIKYTPLSKNMNDHFSILMSSSILKQTLTYSVLTDIATCPLTILFSLQSTGIPLDTMNSLTAHLVGAEAHFEVDTMKKWETFILHFLPQLKHLRIVFIGPELNVDMLPEQLIHSGKCCAECSSQGCTVKFDFLPATLYHDYKQSSQYCKPDIICAFNAGLYRSTGFDNKDTWPPSIDAMLGHPYAPVVVTAYTAEELPLDISRMSQCSPLKIILPASHNPFSSKKPSLNFVSDEKMPLIYKNFYISIVQGVKDNPVR